MIYQPRPSHILTKKKALMDVKTHQLYEELEEEFSLLAKFIKARHDAGKTQADIAHSMGTPTSAVGRLESGIMRQKHSPSLNTLYKYAKALGYKLDIHLTPCD